MEWLWQRCRNVDAVSFPDYGGRGITVCDRWLDFVNFLADMGPRPSPKHSIDRFPDNDGNYEPGNCRWATIKEQMNNKRNNHREVHNGVTKTLAEWENCAGISANTLSMRLSRGWSIGRAIETPVRVYVRTGKVPE